MTNRPGFVVRLLADLLVACLVVLAFFVASRSENDPLRIGALVVQFLAVGVAAYLEPSAKKVWIHPLAILSPELIALPAGVLLCKGHGCAGMFVFAVLAYFVALLMVGLSYAVFYIRSRIVRSGGE
jgi:hypothetical protein